MIAGIVLNPPSRVPPLAAKAGTATSRNADKKIKTDSALYVILFISGSSYSNEDSIPCFFISLSITKQYTRQIKTKIVRVTSAVKK